MSGDVSRLHSKGIILGAHSIVVVGGQFVVPVKLARATQDVLRIGYSAVRFGLDWEVQLRLTSKSQPDGIQVDSIDRGHPPCAAGRSEPEMKPIRTAEGFSLE